MKQRHAHLFVRLLVCVCFHVKIVGHMWRSEVNPLDSVLSFHCVGPGMELARLGGTCLYLLSHFYGLCFYGFLNPKIFLGMGGSAHACAYTQPSRGQQVSCSVAPHLIPSLQALPESRAGLAACECCRCWGYRRTAVPGLLCGCWDQDPSLHTHTTRLLAHYAIS